MATSPPVCLAALSASPARGATPAAAPEVLADRPLLHGILLPRSRPPPYVRPATPGLTWRFRRAP
ncbi:hypothetical protein [Streptomyces decoyicus]|uniref:hypothetical protein n=1 Tax=Streptomyces decoyicus TaxID=249567 RepID=UPI003665C93C